MIARRAVRAILAASAAILAMGAACTTSSTPTGIHWPRAAGETEAVVWLMIAPDADYPETRDAIAAGAAAWSTASPYVEIRWQAGRCASYPWERCADVYLGEVRAVYASEAITSTGWGAGGHLLSGSATYVQFDFAILYEWTAATRRQYSCHEIGHVIGLGHGSDGGVGPCSNGWPTATDLTNVAHDYGHAD